MGRKNKRRHDEEQPAGERATSGRVKKKAYEKELEALSVELVKLQEWVKHGPPLAWIDDPDEADACLQLLPHLVPHVTRTVVGR